MKKGYRVAGLLILLLIVSVFLSGCGGVKASKFTQDNVQQIMDEVKNSKDLTGEEHALLVAALVRYKLQKGLVLEGKAVGEIIEEQRKIKAEYEAQEAEKKRLAEEEQKKEAAVAAELNNYLVITPTKKGFQEKDIYAGEFNDYIQITFAFYNKGAKDIRAFRGNTTFTDLFGEKVYSTNLTYDGGVKAGETKTWLGVIKYNQFMDEHSRFKAKELKSLKFVWMPRSILFTDGTTIGLTDYKK